MGKPLHYDVHGQLCLLAMDDDQINLMVVEQLLAPQGWKVGLWVIEQVENLLPTGPALTTLQRLRDWYTSISVLNFRALDKPVQKRWVWVTHTEGQLLSHVRKDMWV